MLHTNSKQDKNINQSSADKITTSNRPAHQRKKEKTKTKTNFLPPECKHKSHPTQSLHKPLDQPYEDRNQKKERIQPQSLGKVEIKYNKLRKKIIIKKKKQRQRNTAQMKEQPRNTQVEINEEGIGKLPDKEFRVMEVKMTQILKDRMERMKESTHLTKT